MTPDELARAGEPFFTTKPPGSGTGLGLFVARSAIEQLGGKLTLESRRDEGTTATILLDRDVVQGDHDGQ
jgi:two-component system sensor histidine kinase RegB